MLKKHFLSIIDILKASASRNLQIYKKTWGFPGGTSGEEPTCQFKRHRRCSVPALGRSSGEGNGNLLQYSCLEKPMDRGAWWTTVHAVSKSHIWLKQLSTHAHKKLRNFYGDYTSYSGFRLKLKEVGEKNRQFRYDLNQIPYDYTVEVTIDSRD